MPATSEGAAYTKWNYRFLKYVPDVESSNSNIVELDGKFLTVKGSLAEIDGPYQAAFENSMVYYGDTSTLVVSLPGREDPSNSDVYVSYNILSGPNVQNIEVEDIEYCTLGTVEFKFGEDA